MNGVRVKKQKENTEDEAKYTLSDKSVKNHFIPICQSWLHLAEVHAYRMFVGRPARQAGDREEHAAQGGGSPTWDREEEQWDGRRPHAAAAAGGHPAVPAADRDGQGEQVVPWQEGWRWQEGLRWQGRWQEGLMWQGRWQEGWQWQKGWRWQGGIKMARGLRCQEGIRWHGRWQEALSWQERLSWWAWAGLATTVLLHVFFVTELI